MYLRSQRGYNLLGLTEKVKDPLLHSISAAGLFEERREADGDPNRESPSRSSRFGSSRVSDSNPAFEGGERDVVLITENRKAGTSRNTGSDKQTYYKISLAGDQMDSVANMAQDLLKADVWMGIQLSVRAALSARGFYSLVEMGVPFPESLLVRVRGIKQTMISEGEEPAQAPIPHG